MRPQLPRRMRRRSTSTRNKVRLLPFAAIFAVFLTGCQARQSEETSSWTVTDNGQVVASTRSDKQPVNPPEPSATGNIIDEAGALRPTQMRDLAMELRDLNQAGGPRMTVVLARPSSGESLEHLGWAVAGRPSGSDLVLMVDPEATTVRVEGALAPEQKARIATAMLDHLRAEQPAEAIRAAIAIVRDAL